MYSIIGSCPKCGAPIFTYSMWHGVTPPPPLYTCGCFPGAKQITSSGTVIVSSDGKSEVKEKRE